MQRSHQILTLFQTLMFGLSLLPGITWSQPTADELLEEAFGIQQVATGCAFTEGPIVDAEGTLYFSDGPNDRIMQLTPDGRMSTFLQPCGAANGLMFDPQGRILLCQSARGTVDLISRLGASPGFLEPPSTEKPGLAPKRLIGQCGFVIKSTAPRPSGARAVAIVDRSTGTPRAKTLVSSYQGNRFIAPNDLCIDGDGSIFFTDPYYNGEKSQPNSGVYRLDANGACTLLLSDLQKPNGIVITPNHMSIYISDRGTQQLHRYRLTDDKRLVNDTVVYDFSPDRGIDGMWLDVDGNIYGAAGEDETTGLFVISPEGRLLLHRPLPEFATNVTFGGKDMRDIYVTATTSVYKLRAKTPGVRHLYTVDDTTRAITSILENQVKAWNAGDITAFMEPYWKSDELTFSSGGRTRRGWNATLRRYQTVYDTPEKMGQLTFSRLRVDLQAPGVALVLGNWDLRREVEGDIGGNFSLLFRQIDGQWLIVHDHSSALDED